MYSQCKADPVDTEKLSTKFAHNVCYRNWVMKVYENVFGILVHSPIEWLYSLWGSDIIYEEELSAKFDDNFNYRNWVAVGYKEKIWYISYKGLSNKCIHNVELIQFI